MHCSRMRPCHSLKIFQSTAFARNLLSISRRRASRVLGRAKFTTQTLRFESQTRLLRERSELEAEQSDDGSQDAGAEAARKLREIRKRNIIALSTANKRQSRDIYPHSLSATLEAHRESNRAPPIYYTGHGARNAKLGQRESLDRHDESLHHISTAESPSSLPGDESQDIREKWQDQLSPSRQGKKYLKVPKKRGEVPPPPLEYVGQNVPPVISMVNTEEDAPWMPSKFSSSLATARLNDEIAAFYAYIRPTPEEVLARKYVYERTKSIAQAALPLSKLEIFGSETTGLSLAFSDIDLRLIPSKYAEGKVSKAMLRAYYLRQEMDELFKLQTAFRKAGDFVHCDVKHARFSLLSAMHRDSGIQVQVVLSTPTSAGDETIKTILARYDGIREVYSLLKVVSDIRGLNDVYQGGMGSYGLFMMLVASIESDSSWAGHGNLVDKLQRFLDYWSNFDTYHTCMSPFPYDLFSKPYKFHKNAPNLFPRDQVLTLRSKSKLSRTSEEQPFLLVLQDPADATNDLGSKVYRIKHIQETIRHMDRQLRRDLERYEGQSLLSSLVGGCHKFYGERRIRTSEWARKQR